MSVMSKSYGALEVQTPSDTEIRFTRLFKALPQLVFDAHTKPELIKLWLLGPDGWTMPVCEVDLKAGGKFRYVWHKAPDKNMGMGGTFIEIDTPHYIVHSEMFDEDWTGGETTVTTVFAESSTGTTMTMTVKYPSKEGRDGALGSGMTDGMEAGYARLDTLLA